MFLPVLLTFLVSTAPALMTRVLADSTDSARIERLVRLLASENFEEREEASRQLDMLGQEALPALHDNMSHADAEVRIRATRLFQSFMQRRFGKEEPLRHLQRDAKVWDAVFSPDAKFAATAGQDRKARVWDLSSGEEVCCCEGHLLPLVGVAFSPDGQRLLTASRDNTVRTWQVRTGKETRCFTNSHRESLGASAFSRDGKCVLSAGHYVNVLAWNLETGKVLSRRVSPDWTEEKHAEITSVGISPDHHIAVIGRDDGTLSLWDFETWKALRTFTGHTGAVNSVAFSSDGKQLLSGGKDATMRLWDATTGKQILCCKSPDRAVHSVAMANDGHFALCGGDNVTLWHLPSGRELRCYQLQIGTISSVSFSSDGRRIIASGVQGGVVIWGSRR